MSRREVALALLPRTKMFLADIYGSFSNYLNLQDIDNDPYRDLAAACLQYDFSMYMAYDSAANIGLDYLNIVRNENQSPQEQLYNALLNITSDKKLMQQYSLTNQEV